MASISAVTTKTILVPNSSKAASNKMPFSSSVMHLGTPNTAKRLTASCQQIIEETFSEAGGKVIVRSCLADSELYPIISGHKCNKVANPV